MCKLSGSQNDSMNWFSHKTWIISIESYWFIGSIPSRLLHATKCWLIQQLSIMFRESHAERKLLIYLSIWCTKYTRYWETIGVDLKLVKQDDYGQPHVRAIDWSLTLLIHMCVLWRNPVLESMTNNSMLKYMTFKKRHSWEFGVCICENTARKNHITYIRLPQSTLCGFQVCILNILPMQATQ